MPVSALVPVHGRMGGFLSLAVAVLTLGIVATTDVPASAAAKLVVDDDLACPGSAFTSINAALTAAAPGNTVEVCSGTYMEQVDITLNDLKLIERGGQDATIKAPPAMTGNRSIVEVSGATGVVIDGFTISGPGDGTCNSIRSGVRVDGGGHASIQNNHITEIHDTPLGGCQDPTAIQVGLASESQTGSATIWRNTMDNYQKAGVAVSNTGSSAEVGFNSVTGIGPTPVIAQNGVHVTDGATGNVHHNEVSDHLFTVSGFASTGILLTMPGAVEVTKNQLAENDLGIVASGATSPVIDTNNVSGSTYNGLDLRTGTTGAHVSHNTSTDNGNHGILVWNSTGNWVAKNKTSDSDFNGIYLLNAGGNWIDENESRNDGTGLFVENSTSNSIDRNKVTDSPFFEFYVLSSSTGNSITHNHLKDKIFGGYAQDDSVGTGTAGTANTWVKNKCDASTPPGLCD